MNIRIFFSSPGDVKMERETAKRIVDRLQSEIGATAEIQPYFWEHEVMVATKDYQENIPQMDDFDIVVCILWSRLGTPLDPARHPRPGGGGFASGTEYEFFTAMKAHEVRGTPDIFVFRNSTEPRRPSRPKEVREAVDREIDRLDSFFETYFHDDTFFTRAINIYSTLGEFEDKLTIALRSYILGRIPVSPSKIAAKNRPTYDRQPYLGLASFDYEDAPVFFGRTAQVGEIITALQSQELEAQSNPDTSPKHFTLILGSSGSGKSSLARAGVLPMLTNPGVIEGANAWRTAIFKPADSAGDPILALVNSLDSPRALPELFADGTKPRELADLIRVQPQGVGLLLRQALTQAGALALANSKIGLETELEQVVAENREEDAKVLREKIDTLETPAVRLALLADQLEELFTTDLSPVAVDTFVSILVALANSGRVFLIATLRSDFYPRCLEHPALVGLMQGNGTYALPAPSATDIGQMIRQPAAIAGLTFEERPASGEKLDELLRDAALEDPAALPLLSYTLEQLYEQRTPEGLLTLDAYRQLGGLEGAIGSRAETVYNQLPAEAQGAFDGLCKQLVTLQEGGEPTRRRAFYSTLTRTRESKTLVDALIAARLLTADQSPDGERIVSVAHEALLRHWPRLVSWVEENRIFLHTRTRIASRLSDWLEKNKSDEYLLPRGPNLSSAELILSGHLASLDPQEVEFITRSAERVRREDQRHLRNARLISAGAIVLCLIAVAGGLFAMAAKRSAQKERNVAIEQEKLAKQATARVVASEARSAYVNGIEQLEAGRARKGISSLARGLAIQPAHQGAISRIYSELIYSLPRPVPIRSVVASSQMRQRISGSYSAGNQYVTYIAADKSPEVFDLAKGAVVPGPWSEEKKTVAPALSYHSDYLLVLQEEGDKYAFRCWNLLTKKPGASVSYGSKEFHSMLVTTDGKYFVFALSDGNVKFVNTTTGKTEISWKQSGTTAWVSEIPGKFIISTYSDSIVIFNLATQEKKTLEKTGNFVFQDGRVGLNSDIFVASSFKPSDSESGIMNRFVFYDAKTGEPLPDSRTIEVPDYVQDYRPDMDGRSVAVAIMQKGPRIYDAFQESADRTFPAGYSAAKVAFSCDGRHLVTATEEGTVNIFDIKSAQPAFAPIPHEAKLEDLLMTWNGQYLLTASGTTATVWDLAVGTGLSPRLGLPENPVLTKISEGALTVQTSKRVYRIDTAALTMNPVSTMLTYVAPLVSPSLDRSAAFIGKGLISFHARKPDQETETKLCEWQCPGGKVDMWQFSQDGSLFVATAGARCWVLDPGNGSVKAEFTLPGSARYTPFVTADNRFVFNLYPKDGLNYEHGLHGWDLSVGKEVVFQFNDALRNQLRYPFVSVSPDSRWLAIASVSTGGNSVGTTFLWDLQNLQLPARELVSPGAICQLEFSPDGKKLALASVNGGIQIRSLETGDLLAPTLDPGGSALNLIAFSPDSSSLATSVTGTLSGAEAPSEIRIWDWLEAVPITRVFPVPTTVSHLHVTPDGRSLLAIFPRKGKPSESIIQAWEIAPPQEISPLLLPLAEAATAYHIEAGNLPAAINPFLSWEVFRKAQPDSWFLQPPEDRSVSPAFPAASMRWIKDELIEIDALLAAMPCVALSNAAIANWRQTHLTNLSNDTTSQDTDSKKTADLADSVARLRVIPERNPDAHPLIPYYLALQARSESDAARLKKYSQLAYERNPENADCAELAAKTYEDAGDYKSALPILREIRVLAPDNHEYGFRLGTALWALGQKTEAQAEFAISADSKHLTDLHRAIILVYMGRAAEALPLFEKMAEEQKAASPDKTYRLDSLVYLITGHLSVGNKEAAAGFFQQLVTAAPAAADPETIRKATLHPLLTESLLSAIKLKQ